MRKIFEELQSLLFCFGFLFKPSPYTVKILDVDRYSNISTISIGHFPCAIHATSCHGIWATTTNITYLVRKPLLPPSGHFLVVNEADTGNITYHVRFDHLCLGPSRNPASLCCIQSSAVDHPGSPGGGGFLNGGMLDLPFRIGHAGRSFRQSSESGSSTSPGHIIADHAVLASSSLPDEER